MMVYEFWLKAQFRDIVFETLCASFGNIGGTMTRALDGQLGSAAYAVRRNSNTHWVQLSVEDAAPASTLTAIEAKINELKDNAPFRKYTDDSGLLAPRETPKHFTMDKVLEIRAKQKETYRKED